MKVKDLGEKDLENIRAAVKSAEGTTSGEIVPYLVSSSDDYEEVNFKSAVLFMLAPLLLLGILSYGWLLPFQVNILEVVLVVVAMSLLGYFMPEIFPAYKRMLLSERRLRNAVERRALAAFLEQEVFYTENRTGILLFISRFEHMVEVIGDSGINEKVDPADWDQVVTLIVDGIRNGAPAEGIIRGIGKCGEMLAAAGVNKPPDNPNELPDDLRLG